MKVFPLVQVTSVTSLLLSSILANPVEFSEGRQDTGAETHTLGKRETACIALDDCGGAKSAPSSVLTTQTTTSPAQTSSSTTSMTPASSATSTTSAPLTVQSEICRYTKDCNKSQKKVIEEAWSDAYLLAKAHNKWVPKGYISGGSYQAAQDM